MGGACACARIQHFGAKMRFKRESDGEYIIIKQPMTVLMAREAVPLDHIIVTGLASLVWMRYKINGHDFS